MHRKHVRYGCASAFLVAVASSGLAAQQLTALTPEAKNRAIANSAKKAHDAHRDYAHPRGKSSFLPRASEVLAYDIPEDGVPLNGDIQKFYESTARAWGPKALISATIPCQQTCRAAAAFQDRPTHRDGELVATISVQTAPSSAFSQQYTDLHLTDGGTYCVRVQSTLTSGTFSWKGYVLPIPPNEPECPERQALLPAVSLRAVYDPVGSNVDDYPQTARWGEASVGANLPPRGAIEVWCGRGWCTLLPPNADTLRHLYDPPTADLDSRKRTRLRGWHDEQTISSTPLDPADPLYHVLSPGYRAVVIPRFLETQLPSPSHFNQKKWIATVFFDRAPVGDKYAAKGFTAQVNKVYVQHFDSTATVKDHWEAWVGSDPSIVKHMVVTPIGHGASPVEPTARWAWKDTDEDIWIRCPQGCCYIDIDSII